MNIIIVLITLKTTRGLSEWSKITLAGLDTYVYGMM